MRWRPPLAVFGKRRLATWAGVSLGLARHAVSRQGAAPGVAPRWARSGAHIQRGGSVSARPLGARSRRRSLASRRASRHGFRAENR